MEKGVEEIGMRKDRPKKVVITGPESTGKTTLAERLAKELKALLIPEYARSYVEALDRPYSFEDVEQIARYQIAEEHRISSQMKEGILILDTWLDVTKVWFELVYSVVPEWLDASWAETQIDLFLVCSPDLPWIPDPVRENGGEMRRILFNHYCREIDLRGYKYEIIEGVGEKRVESALYFLEKHQIIKKQ